MGHLKVCCRLTYTHVYPTNFQKMSVKLAMSDSVADGFCFYRDTMKNEAFRHTQNVEHLFRLLNRSFFNARNRFAPAMNDVRKPEWKQKDFKFYSIYHVHFFIAFFIFISCSSCRFSYISMTSWCGQQQLKIIFLFAQRYLPHLCILQRCRH